MQSSFRSFSCVLLGFAAKLGKTRKSDMTSKQLGVKFRVMTEEERESYSSDLIGHGVTDMEGYWRILKRQEKVEQGKNRDFRAGNSGKHTTTQQNRPQRAQVNTMSAQVRKDLKEKFRAFT